MEEKTIEVNFFCDESGNLHSNSPKRYFVIGGYFCLAENNKDIRQSFTRAIKKIKVKRKMLKTDELKTKDMTPKEKIKLFEALQVNDGFYGFALVVDKNAMFRRIDKESVFYNYFVKIIIDTIVIPKVKELVGEEQDTIISMKLDSRNVSVGHLKSLEDYLNSEHLFTRFSFKADYVDSKIDFRIQAADLISNTIYMKFKDFAVVKEVFDYLDISNKIYYVKGFPGNKRYIKKVHPL